MGSFLGVNNRGLAPAGLTSTPTFSPAAGTYGTPQSVSIACSNPGAAIYFTTDGSTPTFPISGTTAAYAGPVSVSGPQTLNAIAIVAGFLTSAVGSAAYVFTVATPTFSPAAGTYSSAQTVTLSCATSGSTIYFTTDGSTPSVIGGVPQGTTQQYTAPITISSTGTVKVIGLAAGYATSSVGSASYVISGTVFNFFIAPNGDDNNNGLTPSTAWSLTALNTKQSTYRGQKIGIIGDIGGTQTPLQYGQVGGVQTTIYSYLNTTINQPFLNIDGGTSGSPTYIGSCNSSGVYTRGWAIIDCSNPSGGAHPSLDQAILMGQNGNTATQVPHPDNITYDGLTIRNFSYCAISEESNGTDFTAVVIQNCEFYGSNTAISNDNPGCVRFQATNGAQVLNCKFHDCQTSSSGSFFPYAYPGVFSYSSNALTITNCTFYNIQSIEQKDSTQDAVISYCYLDQGAFGVATGNSYAASYYIGINAAGRTTTIHHCIMLGMCYLTGVVPVYGGHWNYYNNTVYIGSSNPVFYTGAQPLTGSTLTAYNNILYPLNGAAWGTEYGVIKFINASTTLIPQWDYNYYRTSPEFCPSGSGGVLVNLASWQALGFDAHSLTGGSPFTTTPSAPSGVPNISSFTVNPSSPAATGGIGGAMMGALDGSGTVGCNF